MLTPDATLRLLSVRHRCVHGTLMLTPDATLRLNGHPYRCQTITTPTTTGHHEAVINNHNPRSMLKTKQTAKCPKCTADFDVKLTVTAMHQHLASVHFQKSQRVSRICVTSQDHSECPPTTTCLLREARNFVREAGVQPSAADQSTSTLVPAATLSSTDSVHSSTTSELRALVIQATKTSEALSARLDALVADAAAVQAERNEKALLPRSPARNQDRSRDARRGEKRFRSRSEGRSRDANRQRMDVDRNQDLKRSSRSRGDERFRSEGRRRRGATPAASSGHGSRQGHRLSTETTQGLQFYRDWAREIDANINPPLKKVPHITYVCNSSYIDIYIRMLPRSRPRRKSLPGIKPKKRPTHTHTHKSSWIPRRPPRPRRKPMPRSRSRPRPRHTHHNNTFVGSNLDRGRQGQVRGGRQPRFPQTLNVKPQPRFPKRQ